MYRIQVLDRRTAVMHWQIHKDGAAHLRDSQGRVPVAVAIGTHPATTYSATAPLPPGIDEMIFAGFLRGRSVEMVRCRTVDLEVPAESEVVLEGYVDASDLRPEGPFGDHTGFYTPVDEYRPSTSPACRCAPTRSTRPRSSARRRWRTSTSARPPSASSCRSSA